VGRRLRQADRKTTAVQLKLKLADFTLLGVDWASSTNLPRQLSCIATRVQGDDLGELSFVVLHLFCNARQEAWAHTPLAPISCRDRRCLLVEPHDRPDHYVTMFRSEADGIAQLELGQILVAAALVERSKSFNDPAVEPYQFFCIRSGIRVW
jgi:hypothetical protein